ncbi:MAG: Ig-like domain-containing protein [Thomasclavelia sp.]|uniref:Ig-like domain-containing protein n=1 Tax=Thomasclavelia sp. TaxID=3025757 RepID=UPI0039926EBE
MKIKLIVAMLISSLLMNSFIVAPVYGENDEPDQTLLENHVGGLLDYTQMYGLEKNENEVIRYQPYLRSSAPQENNYLAIMVEFPDKTGTSLDDAQTLSKADAVMNKGNRNMETPNGSVPIISLKEYVEKYTYHKMTTKTTFLPQDRNGKVISVKLSKNRSYYMKKSASNPNGYTLTQAREREEELINEILSKSKESIERIFSASDLDKNNDGNVDAISFFIEADKVTEDKVEWSDLLWSHKISGMNLNVDLEGKKINTYNLINTYDSNYLGGVFSMNQGTYGTIIHEYMHVLGLPDLYRYNSSGDPVGFYDIMATTINYNPQGILTYMTSEYNNLGWNSMSEIKSSTSVTLNKPQYSNPSEKRAVKIVSPVSDDEFFIVEYYEKQNKVYTSDTSISDGLVVYRINSKVKNGNMNGTTAGKKDYLYVFRPNETGCGKGEGNLNQAVLSKNGRSSIGKPLNTTYSWNNDTLFYSNGTNSGITINITNSSSNSITFDVNVPIVQGDGSTTKPYLISSVNDFDLIRKNSTKAFKLLNDVDLSGVSNFQSISNFSGVLDGNGFAIKNLTLNNQSSFINTLSNRGIVKNLNFKNISIKNTNATHTGIFGTVNGQLENIGIKSGKIFNQVNDNGQYLGTGALAGLLSSGGIIKNCYSSASVTQGINVGGLIGLNQNGTIQDCYVNGAVSSGKKSSGAVIGTQYFISYDRYKQSENVLYDINKTKQNEAIGTVYGSDKLIDNKTGREGFIGVDLLKEMTLDLSGIKEKELGLTVKANPTTSLSKKVTIKDTSIATYNSITNKIQARKRGKTELTVSLPVGNNTMILSSTINVVNSNIPITSVTLNKQNMTLVKGTSETLKATINPSDTTDSKVLTWITSDSKVATVDSNGKVTGVSEGKATITVRTSNGKTASCKVAVVQQEPELVYQAHVADYGWLKTVSDGETAGTTGKNKQMEAIKINLINNVYKGTVEYSTHVADYGWMAWTDNGKLAGTEGKNKQMEAIKIKLTGELEEKYDIYYRVHAEELGWLDWTSNGKVAGSAGYCYQIEAIEIKLVEKGSKAPGATERAYVQKRYIKYASHVADYGWLADVYDGSISGTIGKCKQMEAIKISLENQPYEGAIEYRTHSADIGWQEFRSNGMIAGTIGRNKQMEAIEIQLTGKMEKEYDIYYRVHIADYGWLDWAKNGASAGSEGMSKRIETMEIRIVQKGGSEPGKTARPFIKK